MRIRLVSAVVVAFVASLTGQAQEKLENPFKNAKVGDFVAYKMTTSFMGKDFEVSMKQTVTAKSDTEVTIKQSSTVLGKDLPGQDAKIDLTKPFDPFAAAMQQKKKGNFEKTGDGKEKIVVGGKTYDCNWMSGKVVADAGGKKFESEIKVWLSKSVPLSGMVKMEMKSSFANVQMEIVESGSAK